MGYVSLQEAARRLRVSRATLYRWSREGRIRLYRIGPRATRMREEDLERLEGDARPLHTLWGEAAQQDLWSALEWVEDQSRPEEIASYLETLSQAGVPVRWNPELGEFESRET